MSKGEKTFRKLVVKKLESLNPDSSFQMDSEGFIRVHRKNLDPCRLPKGWTCPEGQDARQNSITLRHLYSENEKFIATLIVYQNA